MANDLDMATIQKCEWPDAVVAEVGRQLGDKLDALYQEMNEQKIREWTGAPNG